MFDPLSVAAGVGLTLVAYLSIISWLEDHMPPLPAPSTPVQPLRLNMQDFLLSHAREFTDIEVEGDQIWNALQDAGLPARDLLDAFLMWEHFTANLPHNPDDRTPEQVTQQNKLRDTAQRLAQRAREDLAGHVDQKVQQ